MGEEGTVSVFDGGVEGEGEADDGAVGGDGEGRELDGGYGDGWVFGFEEREVDDEEEDDEED